MDGYMTVRELIGVLQSMPLDAEVYTTDYEGDTPRVVRGARTRMAYAFSKKELPWNDTYLYLPGEAGIPVPAVELF